MSKDNKLVVSKEEFEKQVEKECEWIKRYEYEHDQSNIFQTAHYRISQDYKVE